MQMFFSDVCAAGRQPMVSSSRRTERRYKFAMVSIIFLAVSRRTLTGPAELPENVCSEVRLG
jgi:hypothetical protein